MSASGGATGAMKACPRCGESIRAVATRCRYCLSDLEKEKDDSPGSFILGNPALFVPVVTFLYTAFQVFKASDYEVNTAVELVRASGVTTILLGVLLVQLPVELWITILVGCVWFVLRGRRGSSTSSRYLLVFASGPLVLGLAISPWMFTVLALAFLAGGVWALRTTNVTAANGFVVVALIATVASASYLLTRPTIWMAAETVALKDGTDRVGYVVSTDDSYTTILTPSWTKQLVAGHNTLERIPSDEVKARTLCAFQFSDAKAFNDNWHLRPFEIPFKVFGSSPSRRYTPSCPAK